MDRQALNSVCEQVYRRFPEVSGSQPKVQSRPNEQFLVVFTGVGHTADGRKITHTIRVVANQAGKIIKVSTSR